MATCSIFHYNKTIPREEKSLILIGNDIKSGIYKEPIEKIRALIREGKTEEADKLKFKLKSFSPSATFTERRKPEFLKMYSYHIHLDFDHIKPEELGVVFEKVKSDRHTFMCFVSVRGSGVKIFIEVDSGAEHHSIAYQQVKDYFEKLLGLKSDPKCKDIGRLCFVSDDPNLYKNLANEKFHVLLSENKQHEKSSYTPKDIDLPEVALDAVMLFHQQMEFTNRKIQYSDGDRNNYVYSLACNCNRVGIPLESTAELIFQFFNLPEKEMMASVRSAYEHHKHEFAKFAKSAMSANRNPSTHGLQDNIGESHEGDEDIPDYLRLTPLIPDEVFEKLPMIIKDGAKVYSDRRKRDVFITGVLAMLSGCLPKVTGIYFQERVYPHLFVFIIAPSANGKAALKNAKKLVRKYHDQVVKRSREEIKNYERELLEYNDQKRNRKSGAPPSDPPKKPSLKLVLIPADCSHARLVEHLQNNGGQGIICETEADVMSGTKKQEWGDYSTLLRMAFHHETYTYSRKTNDEYFEIEEPRIAMGLSGTPGQVPKLIASAEDGLFSRILFYAYKSPIDWQDPSPRANPIVFNDHFDQMSEQVLNLTRHLDQFPTEVLLSDMQWDALNSSFTGYLNDVAVFSGEEAASIVYRLGLILFRFCMIFTALRKYESRDMKAERNCTDEDFDSALRLAQMYLHHSLLMFSNLPSHKEVAPYLDGASKRKFFEQLPQEFQRKEAVILGETRFELSKRTVDDILKLATGTKLEKLKAGRYRKMN